MGCEKGRSIGFVVFLVMRDGETACVKLYTYLIPTENSVRFRDTSFLVLCQVPLAHASYTFNVFILEVAHDLSLRHSFLGPIDNFHLFGAENLKNHICHRDLDPWVRIRRQHA